MDFFIEAYVTVPNYSHANEMVIRNIKKIAFTYNIIYVSNNLVKH